MRQGRNGGWIHCALEPMPQWGLVIIPYKSTTDTCYAVEWFQLFDCETDCGYMRRIYDFCDR